MSSKKSNCARPFTVFLCFAASFPFVALFFAMGEYLTDLSTLEAYKASVTTSALMMLGLLCIGYDNPELRSEKPVLTDKQNRHRSIYFLHQGAIALSVFVLWMSPLWGKWLLVKYLSAPWCL